MEIFLDKGAGLCFIISKIVISGFVWVEFIAWINDQNFYKKITSFYIKVELVSLIA